MPDTNSTQQEIERRRMLLFLDELADEAGPIDEEAHTWARNKMNDAARDRMTDAAEITQVDGIVVSEALEGLVGIRLAGSALTTDLIAGQQVAFRPVDRHSNDDRFVGTVTSVDGPTQLTVLLDRIALTQMLTIKEREVSPISTAPGANEDGTQKWLG